MYNFKFNKGEWSELFVFLSVLTDGKIYAADENLVQIKNKFYLILKVIRENHEYIRDSENKLIIIRSDKKEFVVPLKKFALAAPELLKEIQEATGSSFELPFVEPFLDMIEVRNIKANSKRKGDLTVQIHDDYTGFEPIIDFSIKSYLGGTPTLLNASGATVCEFSTSKNVTQVLADKVNSINSTSKIKDRIKLMRENNIELEFVQMIDSTFSHNLEMIDFNMPEILSQLCLCSYFVKGKRIPEVVTHYCETYKQDKDLIEYKVKSLLVSIALGMVPKTKWTGMDEANGGYIIVKSDGEIVCYHIYDRNRLKDYLYNHTKFDSPSSKRTKAGTLEIKNDKGFFRLTCQIRFI